MRWFRRSAEAIPPPSRLQKRVARIATVELIPWAEQTMYVLGRTLRDYDRTGEAPALDQAVEAAEALQAVVRELQRRQSSSIT